MARQKTANVNNKPKSSQSKESRKDKESVKPVKSERGCLSRMIRSIYKLTLTLGVVVFLAATVGILLNCADGAKNIKGSKPLCADLTRLSEFKGPSPLFFTNARNTYSTVLHGYWGRIQPSVHALQKKWNEYYREFVKSDIGITVDRQELGFFCSFIERNV
ncbi:unnamed protein product [Strongylus vulgaris]|uniref:Uncharacterized protein n=1 Tax=Strongylus vulgaris TaxID=40348 RepID=A0A3P7IR48_STRVU|nr:unnamed protein product [Strongylus vulgaris]